MAKSQGGTGRDRRREDLRTSNNSTRARNPVERGFSRIDIAGRLASNRNR